MLGATDFGRRIFHLALGLAIVFLAWIGLLNGIVLLCIAIIGFILSFASAKHRIPVLRFFLEAFERETEIRVFPGKGMIFMFVGAGLALLFFPKNIALASITILALGDSVAPLVGRFGSLKHPLSKRKFLEGSFAGFLAAFVGAMIFVSPVEALLGSFAAMAVEGIDLRLELNPADDNIVMPLVAGCVILLFRAVV